MSDSGLFRALPLGWRNLDPKSFRILVAEDDHSLRTILVRTLTHEGYQVDATAGGTDLLETVKQRAPDLIVLDLMMPGMDGLTLISHLRRDPALTSIYVIVVTGRSTLEDKVEGFETGADDYVTKPVPIKELHARVKAGIRIRTLQRSLEHSYRMIVRQEKLATVGALASGISHEFNNIISGISGYAQLARRNDAYKERLIEVALEQSERVQKITSSLSTYASSMSAERKPTLPQPLIESAIWLLDKEIQKRDIRVHQECGENLPPVRVNFSQIQQALVHLLLNAVQAAGQGGSIALRVHREREQLVVEVDDTGPGVAAELRHRIFDPFFTTKGAIGGGEVPGSGLGLSFALNIATAHEGSLDLVPSRLGGACFRLSLPLDAGAPGAAPDSGVAAAPREAAEADPPRVVVVEDDPFLIEVIQEVLAGAHPTIFSEGMPAVAYCREHSVDVALVDISLPGAIDGLQVISELGRLRDPPSVILSSGAADLVDTRALSPHIACVLRKPFEIAELERAFAAALARSHS